MWRAYEEAALFMRPYPGDFDEAQRRHLGLNPGEIQIWD
jgi:hypothetical protein